MNLHSMKFGNELHSDFFEGIIMIENNLIKDKWFLLGAIIGFIIGLLILFTFI